MDIKENFKGHLSTINHHKMEVMRLCFKVGLYKQGLMHDLSKYSPKEFISGVVFYTGDKSPNTTERRVTGKSEAWLHHKGRNRHHFEYWIDYGQEPGSAMQGTKMPVKYVVEMFCDRVAACKTYYKENYNDSMPFEYFNKNRKHYMSIKRYDVPLSRVTRVQDGSDSSSRPYFLRSSFVAYSSAR